MDGNGNINEGWGGDQTAPVVHPSSEETAAKGTGGTNTDSAMTTSGKGGKKKGGGERQLPRRLPPQNLWLPRK